MLHPFIQESLQSIGSILKRFPVTVIWALIVTGCTLYGNYSDQWEPGLGSSIMIGGLALAASLAGHIFSHTYPKRIKWNWIVWTSIWLFLGINFWYWYRVLDDKTFNICSAVFYCGQLILLTLLVSTIPFWRQDFHNQKLLTYNRRVFTSYVFTALLSAILYIALSLAILVVDNLFKLNIDGKIYLYLMIFIAGLVWTGLFLNAYPADYQDDSTSSYPAFRFIIQYIGIPVVIVYAIILIFYASANIFLQQQMEEWILWLILWFYVLGFLIFCLNYSIKDAEEATWSKWFYKWYLWGSIPISLLNLVGLWKAISEQGVSELTYILATFSLFLLFASIYLIWSLKKDFRLILAVLFLLVFVSTIGPFNMCKATINSQLYRLESHLIDYNILKDGKLQKLTDDISFQDQRIIDSKLDILNNRGSLYLLQGWDGNKLLGNQPYELSEVFESLGLSNVQFTPRQNLSIQGETNKTIDLEDFEKIIPLISSYATRPDSGIVLEYDINRPVMVLYLDGKEAERFNLEDFIDTDSIRDAREWRLIGVNHSVKIHIQYAELNEDFTILNMSGIALYKSNNYED